ncbi:MAG: hypothetical protein ABIT61_02350 [Steroidobacteraceae bacterium]
MNRLLSALLGAALLAAPVARADVGVSLEIGEPGFYGRIDLGNVARPQVIYGQPIIIERRPQVVVVEPIYLRVPPGHAKNWGKHCVRYEACGRPVYFVRDDWYSNVYAPQYREMHGKERHGGQGDQGKGRKK